MVGSTFGADLGQREILLELILSDERASMWVRRSCQASIASICAIPRILVTFCSVLPLRARIGHFCLSSVLYDLSRSNMSFPGGAPGGIPRLTGAGALDPNDPNVKMVSLERPAIAFAILTGGASH